MHDLNNDTALDGLEILSALTHMLPYEELYSKTGGKETEEGEKQFKTAEELKAASDKRKQEAMDYYTSETGGDNARETGRITSKEIEGKNRSKRKTGNTDRRIDQRIETPHLYVIT